MGCAVAPLGSGPEPGCDGGQIRCVGGATATTRGGGTVEPDPVQPGGLRTEGIGLQTVPNEPGPFRSDTEISAKNWKKS